MNDEKGSTNPRKIALLILNQYFRTGKSLKDIINHYFEYYRLSGLDRRFIFNIAKGTVRFFLKIDFVLSCFSDKKIKDIDFIILNILRMGIFQLIYMDKIPPYSVVDECVKLARKDVSLSSSKFVNALLRRASSVSNLELFVEDEVNKLAGKDIDKISIRYSYPVWLVKYWLDWYRKEKTILICKSLNENPHIYLRFNKSKISKQQLKKNIDVVSTNTNILFVGILEDAVEVSSVQNILETDVYRQGLVSIQDLSSQLAVRYFLEPEKNERVLDVCAAPGGKTTYIAELIGNKGEVVSVDINRERLKILKSNLNRLNIRNVRVIEADATEPDFLIKSTDIKENKILKDRTVFDGYYGYFDKILIDAPCSAFGTISKNPDVKYNKSIDDITRLSGESYKMMANCDMYLKAGGRLVFYTCTLSPIENQRVIEKFLKNFSSRYKLEKSDVISNLNSILRYQKEYARQDIKACFEVMPYYFNSEGGFVCSLIKNY